MTHRGVRGPEFVNYISNILTLGKMKPEHIAAVTGPSSIEMYSTAFTSSKVDPVHNYEPLEFLGDMTLNKIIVWCIPRRFPELMNPENVKTMARLKINLIGKMKVAHIARKLGTERYITCTEDEWVSSKNKMLEDTLEALMAALELQIDANVFPGAGYSICYNIIRPVFDEMPISLKHEDLYDAVTRLKEVFDAYSKVLGKSEYDTVQVEGDERIFKTVVFSNTKKTRSKIGEAMATSRKGAQNKAAEAGIKFLEKKGFIRLRDNTDYVALLPSSAKTGVEDMGAYMRASVNVGNKTAYGIGIGPAAREDAVNRAAYSVLEKIG